MTCDGYDLLYCTTSHWQLNNAITIVQIDITQFTDQWCYLISTGTICLVGNKAMVCDWAVEIQTLCNSQHFSWLWNMVVVGSLGVINIILSQGEYYSVFSSLTGLVSPRYFDSVIVKTEDYSFDMVSSEIVRMGTVFSLTCRRFPLSTIVKVHLQLGIWYLLEARRPIWIPTTLIVNGEFVCHVRDV